MSGAHSGSIATSRLHPKGGERCVRPSVRRVDESSFAAGKWDDGLVVGRPGGIPDTLKRATRLHLFIGGIALAGGISVALQDWGSLASLPAERLFSIAVLILLSLFSEVLSLPLDVGRSSTGDSNTTSTSISFIPVLVGVILFGPPAAMVLMVTAGVTAEVIVRKKPPIKVLFNAGQWSVACGLGGLVFYLLGGRTLLEQGVQSRDLLLPFVGFTLVFVLVTHAAVAAVISMSGDLPLREVWQKVIGRSGGNVLYDLLISPVAFAIAVLYIPLRTTGLLLAFLPLFFIRHSYFINLRLQHVNKDLLKALVKAIETRDPYTSGHSLRVASLAKDIAEGMGLSQKQTADVETAALLHDIGKIDVIYEDLLRKPADLSPTERRVIESHVIKGVELLRSMSSFPDEVLSAVRHHHEREDGRGYPDRLRGPEIPVGAKIIKVCDAVDAMLSDRPYRPALTLEAVRSQLIQYSGIQFDLRITETVVSGGILERHAAEVALHYGRIAPHITRGDLDFSDDSATSPSLHLHSSGH
jgi:putative nucleotidyltransferase with HDIG domain